VESDDCVVAIGRKVSGDRIVDEGAAHHVHEGEWVDIIPVGAMTQYIALDKLRRALTNPNQDGLANSMESLCRSIASRVMAWNWTDMKGMPLPPPTSEVIQELAEDEIIYLVNAIQGETVAERKNASGRSPKKPSTVKRPQPKAS
tara:strand:+ start:16601 stop:17035 length:435 start_codon:yes stop_codon:yes gene_type:complete